MTYPNTVVTYNIRRTGMADIYTLTPGASILVAVDKQGGTYKGAVVYTTDTGPLTKSSAWLTLMPDDTLDFIDAIVPPTATGLAFVCTAITDTSRPLLGAVVTYRDRNTANSLSRHQRFRPNSGDAEVTAVTAKAIPPGAPKHWFDFTDKNYLFSDRNTQTPILGVEGEAVNSVWDRGSERNDMDANFGNAVAPLFRADVASSGFAGLRFDAIDATHGAGLRTKREIFGTTPFGRPNMAMVVAAVETAVGQTGDLTTGYNDPEDSAELTITATQASLTAWDAKASQVWSHSVNVVFGGWMENTISNAAASLSTVVGLDTKATGTGNPANFAAVGCNPTGLATFADGCSLLEYVLWGDVIPTRAEVEAYVTTRYGVSWA
jgi:hypothetical protein